MPKRPKRTAPARSPRPAGKAAKGAPETLRHGHVMQAAARVDPELRRRSDLLWEDRSRASRGPRAAFTPEDVVKAAMAIADEEGLPSVTMANVAARLGFTTMAVYRYFPSKEALNDAIVDAGMGLPPEPSSKEGDDWRAEVTRWAHAKREMLCARPWLAELPFVVAPHGPNWLSWLEALARPLARTGLAKPDVGQMISIIDGYTRGASDTSISLSRWHRRGQSTADWAAAVGADLGRSIGDPRFPVFASIITAPADGMGMSLEEGFDFGLQRVLDGIEAYIGSRGAKITP